MSSAVGRTVPVSPVKNTSKTVMEASKKENASLGRQPSNPRGKSKNGSIAGGGDDDFDDKEFQKRYSGKLGKSTDGKVISGAKSNDGDSKKQPVQTPSAASNKTGKGGAAQKSTDKFEKALTKSDINKINNA